MNTKDIIYLIQSIVSLIIILSAFYCILNCKMKPKEKNINNKELESLNKNSVYCESV